MSGAVGSVEWMMTEGQSQRPAVLSPPVDTRTFQQYDRNNGTAQRQLQPFVNAVADPFRAVYSGDRDAQQRVLANVNQAMTDPMMGTFAGQGAKLADLMKLKKAQQMLAGMERGTPEFLQADRAAWQDTGWTHGFADGKPRFEISDHGAELSDTLKSLENGGYKEQPVSSLDYIKRGDKYDISLNPPNPQKVSDFMNLYGINDNILDATLPPNIAGMMRKGISHEPSFLGDLEDASRIKQSFQFEGFNALPSDVAISHKPLFDQYPQLSDVLMQVDPKLGIGGNYANMTSGENVIRVGSGQKLPTALHELQHAIQEREGFAKGGSPTQFRPTNDIRAEKQMLTDANILHAMRQSTSFGTIEEAVNRFKERFNREPNIGAVGVALSGETPEAMLKRRDGLLPPEEMYRNLAGESEARLTQQRMNLTPDQRRQQYPIDSFDVPVNQQIVRGLMEP